MGGAGGAGAGAAYRMGAGMGMGMGMGHGHGTGMGMAGHMTHQAGPGYQGQGQQAPMSADDKKLHAMTNLLSAQLRMTALKPSGGRWIVAGQFDCTLDRQK